MIARSENRAMVDLIPIPLSPVETVNIDAETAVVMVDTQPHTGRRYSEAAMPHVVLDHHDTGGILNGVLFCDIRMHLGATSTMITGYLLEQKVMVAPPLATAMLYGIESETMGYPREASTLDDGALIWLYPRADKDLLARIRNPKLPQSHFATFQSALANAFRYDKLVFSWCGVVTQPDIVAEIADFFIRFDQVDWALAAGVFDGQVKLSLRAGQLGGGAGEVLQAVVNGLGHAGGHDRRAGGSIVLTDPREPAIESTLRTIRHRVLARLGIDEQQGHRLLPGCPVIPAP
jgi:nanoRNase/pAp phosphatase (c-di-AMP/oligoRNAs hydrolase)